MLACGSPVSGAEARDEGFPWRHDTLDLGDDGKWRTDLGKDATRAIAAVDDADVSLAVTAVRFGIDIMDADWKAETHAREAEKPRQPRYPPTVPRDQVELAEQAVSLGVDLRNPWWKSVASDRYEDESRYMVSLLKDGRENEYVPVLKRILAAGLLCNCCN